MQVALSMPLILIEQYWDYRAQLKLLWGKKFQVKFESLLIHLPLSENLID